MLTIRPHPAATMSGSTAWIVWKTPLRLTSITRCQSSKVMLLNRLNPSKPAALTRIVTGPSRWRIAANAASTCERLVTSAEKASPPSGVLRSRVATSVPSALSRRAMASPIPDAPPVTTEVIVHQLGLESGLTRHPARRHRRVALFDHELFGRVEEHATILRVRRPDPTGRCHAFAPYSPQETGRLATIVSPRAPLTVTLPPC